MNWQRFFIRATYSTVLLGAFFVSMFIVLLLQSKIQVFNLFEYKKPVPETIEPFPVSVNSHTKEIIENPAVTEFLTETLAINPKPKNILLSQIAAVFASRNWYQNLASPVSRIIVIWPGERKEQVTKNIADVLGWNDDEKNEFQSLIDTSLPIINDGKYFPGQYVTHRNATAYDIYELVSESFNVEVLKRYTPEVESKVSLNDALIIASLLEREASDFNNMREISGVIWNRLFIDMPLQLDATLQYARGSRIYEKTWWPIVHPRDKFIDSAFNTYQNKGLPPAPIANPSIEAILAALNPINTDCLFYFHSGKSEYYCSPTYEEHVSKLRSIYGRGS